MQTSNSLNDSIDGFPDATPNLTPYREYIETAPQYIPGHGISRYMPSLRNLIPIRRNKKAKDSIRVDQAGLFSFIFYTWLSPFIYKAYKKGITVDDIPSGSPLDSCDLNSQRLELLWQEEVAQKGISGASFGNVVWKFIRTRVLIASILFCCNLLMGFLSPAIFMRQLLEFAQDKNANKADGILWAVCLTCAEFFRLMFIAWYWGFSFRTAIRLRSACVTVLYRKILRLNSLGESSVGELINIFANDSQRIYDMVLFSPMIIGGPLVTICGVCYIYLFLGPWALFGMATFLLFYPTQYGISRLTSYLRSKTIVVTDKRVKLMTEILNCIKLIKMYAWEKYFSKYIKEIRSEERSLLQKTSYCQSLSMSLATTVPVISAVVTFVSHISSGKNLSASQAFPVVVYAKQQIGMVLILVFETGMRFFEGLIAMRRLKAFPVYTFCAKLLRTAMNEARDSAYWLYEGNEAVKRFKAFPIVAFFGNQLKDALSRIREGSRALVDSCVSFPRVKAFPLIVVLNSQLRISFDNLRIGTSNIYDSLVAFPRFKKILCMEDINPYIIRPIDKSEAVRIVDGTFAYNTPPHDKTNQNERSSSQNPETESLNPILLDRQYVTVLNGIRFQASKGKLIGVCGSVGSGKTSLILACLGQMRRLNGQVMRDGTCAYVSQEAWILNATVKENILFGERFDSKRYYEAIYACSLTEDINMLPGGDDTEIGEKGVNLSGGQKQRVALARALYSNRDIYFLDDPLSAVDAHVGAEIFQRYILTSLKSKTVIFVTHQIQYLNNCSEIYMLKDGYIIEQGHHTDLMELNGEYSNMIKTCLMENETKNSSQGQEDIRGDGLKESTSSSKTVVLETKDKDSDKAVNNLMIVPETMERGRIKYYTYHSYISAAGGYCVFALVFCAFLLNVGSSTFSSWWLAMWIKEGGGPVMVVSNGQTHKSDRLIDNPNFSLYRLVYAVSIAVILGTSLLRGFIFTKATLHASTNIHNKLFTKIIHCPMQFFETTPMGRIQNLFAKDMDEVDVHLPMTLEGILQNILIVSFAILLICLVFPWFVLPMIVMGAVYYFMSKIFRVVVRDLKRLETVSRSPIYSWVGTTVQGLNTIHAFDKENEFNRRFTNMYDENSTCLYLCSAAGRWLAVRMDKLAVLITCITAFLIIILQGQVPPAMAGLALAYAAHISGLLQYTIRLISDAEVRFISVERMNAYLQNVACEGNDPKTKPPPTWPKDGRIRFQNVSLSYRKDLPAVLKNVSFSINGAEKIGIVGRTGSGKSSLIVALFRLVELSTGYIKIDGIDTSDVALEELRSKLTVIPQDPILFAGTIRSNIDPLNSFTDFELWSALEKTTMKVKIKQTTEQLDTSVNASGNNFSAGERQLLCLTRALLKNTQILILDEATAAVDPETEVAIQTTIQKEFNSCTVLTIAHRLSTVTSSDKLLVMDKGMVAEFASPSALLADSNSLFYQLWAAAENAMQKTQDYTSEN